MNTTGDVVFHAQEGFMLARCRVKSFPFPNKQTEAARQRKSHLGILHTNGLLGCRKQPADSQISSYREKRCSRKTRGPPHASLLSSQSPSSPRRRSLGDEEGGEERRRGGWQVESEAGSVQRSRIQIPYKNLSLYFNKANFCILTEMCS